MNDYTIMLTAYLACGSTPWSLETMKLYIDSVYLDSLLFCQAGDGVISRVNLDECHIWMLILPSIMRCRSKHHDTLSWLLGERF